MGAIVEEPRFHPQLSGRENLRIVAAVRGPQAHERIAPALARVGLAERADEKVKKYSLGMRQRLGVARCLLADPLLLILDEPTNGLDPGGIQEFREMIRAMVEQEGRTVFISSHLLDEVEKICDHAAIVDRGKIITQGAIAELAEGSTQHELIVGVDDPERALDVLEGKRARARGSSLRRGPARRARRRVEHDRGRPVRCGQRRARRLGPGRISSGAGAPEPGAALPRGHLQTKRLDHRGGDRMNATIAAQMTGADILKLRKKRGMLIWSLVLALGPILISSSVRRYSSTPPTRANTGPPAGVQQLLTKGCG